MLVQEEIKMPYTWCKADVLEKTQEGKDLKVLVRIAAPSGYMKVEYILIQEKYDGVTIGDSVVVKLSCGSTSREYWNWQPKSGTNIFRIKGSSQSKEVETL
jgi:hypothetical protein